MQRKLHPLEGIVVAFALVFVLALTIGFAQAGEPRKVVLRSNSALVVDAETGEVVIDKNGDAVMPIASITKLMTAIVILESGLDLQAPVALSREDVDFKKGSKSRLRTGASLTRDEDPDQITLERAIELINARAAKGPAKKKAARRGKKAGKNS